MKSFDESPESITSDSLSFLSKTAIKFASSGIEGSIYQIIAEALRELNPNAIIVVNSIDSQQEISRTEAFITPPNMLERIISILGFKPVGKSYKIDSSILELESGYIRKFEQGLHELSFKTIPKSISKSLEQLVNLGAIYGIAFLVDGKMYANAAMILPKGDALSHLETIKTFVRQASVTLKRVEAEKKEEKLAESEREKSSLIDNLPGFVYKCANDRNWTMYYLSEKCFNITGYHPQDLINNNKLSYNNIIHPDFKELVWNRWQSALESGTSFQEEYKIITASNKIKWVWEQGSGIYSKDGKVTHLEGFIADITNRKEMEEALKESEANLAELNATKDKFFSIIAHDLKSPFNSIIGIGELLSEQIKKKEFDDLEEYASIMQDSSHKAMNLLTNLLEWSRSQTGRMDFNPEFIRISLLADEVIDLLLYTATQKSIRVISQIPKSAVCFADKAMISSVLRNLVSNAVKFTENGGEVIISAKSSDSKYIVTVSDNGTGMSKEESDNLFRIDKFYSTRGTNNEGGTGLGLILCKEFISRHGCEIWAESKKGKGSNFLFTLPRNSS